MSVTTKITSLEKQLLPTGRAFRAFTDSDMEHLLKGMAESHSEFYDDAVAIFNSLIPDNNDFTADDATDWERRLGLNESTAPLADRKLAILRKMAAPGTSPAKENYLWIQKQLQDAGFPVYVHENIPEQEPGDIYFGQIFPTQCGYFQCGFPCGGFIFGIIANSTDYPDTITASVDQYFDVGANGRAIFYIGGNVLSPYYVTLPLSRETEFRQLVLQLKRASRIAVLFVNFA